MTGKSIETLVTEWLDLDVNPTTRKEIIDLKEAGNYDELELRLRDRITFGTAGLRAKMEAGFSRMNELTVLQASQGLASYISKEGSSVNKSIVVGHDHRYKSEIFAKLVASAFLSRNIKVIFLGNTGSKIVPTPLVPFAIDHFRASAGVMITASHNPAADNGYKVYYSNGCQIISPHDKLIANEIADNLIPWKGVWDFEKVIEKGKQENSFFECRSEMIEAYLKVLSERLIRTKLPNDFKFIYTPMHGVGIEIVEKAMRLLGIDHLIVVEEQRKPDPSFPTVKFPNPEEKGALHLATRRADELGIGLIIANDPDADRFSAAVKHDGSWRQLSGNEIGFLFAQAVVEDIPVETYWKTYLLNSTVSSMIIKSMAKKLGFKFQDTLTGFKWIGNKAIDLENEGFNVPFAFEEAIGFMFSVVHDKDGISALVFFLQMAYKWKIAGTSLIDKLNQGYKKYGYFKECNGYYVLPDLTTIAIIFEEIRKNKPFPSTIGSYEVVSWRDLTEGYDSATTDNIPLLPSDKSSQMITVELKGTKDESIRFTARGSGTEPKLKIYIESKSDISEKIAADVAQDVWKTLKKEWFKPEVYSLVEHV